MVADWYLLAKSNSIVGTFTSSFSTPASWLGDGGASIDDELGAQAGAEKMRTSVILMPDDWVEADSETAAHCREGTYRRHFAKGEAYYTPY